MAIILLTQNGHHFVDDLLSTFQSYIWIVISPKFVPKVPIDNKSVLGNAKQATGLIIRFDEKI